MTVCSVLQAPFSLGTCRCEIRKEMWRRRGWHPGGATVPPDPALHCPGTWNWGKCSSVLETNLMNLPIARGWPEPWVPAWVGL